MIETILNKAPIKVTGIFVVLFTLLFSIVSSNNSYAAQDPRVVSSCGEGYSIASGWNSYYENYGFDLEETLADETKSYIIVSVDNPYSINGAEMATLFIANTGRFRLNNTDETYTKLIVPNESNYDGFIIQKGLTTRENSNNYTDYFPWGSQSNGANPLGNGIIATSLVATFSPNSTYGGDNYPACIYQIQNVDFDEGYYEPDNPYYDTSPEIETLIDAPIINYSIIGQYQKVLGKFRIEEPTANRVKYFITYGTIDGTPQLETTDDNVNSNKDYLKEFTHIAGTDQGDEFGTYLIRAYYIDENDEIISNETTFSMTIRADTLNKFIGVCQNECGNISEEALNFEDINPYGCSLLGGTQDPWISFDGCLDTLRLMIQLATFDWIKFDDVIPIQNWSEINCKELEIFDDWLNLDENYVVCEVFPTEVKDIVTPFIMFAVALMALKWLSTRGDKM